MPVTWSDAHRFHAPERAVWVGVPIDADELPERADLIRTALENRDFVSLCDTLTYETTETSNQWRSAIQSMRTIIE